MRCLITGIGGFTGQHLARFLREQGATVFGIDSPRRKQPCAADVLCCDLTDRAAVRAFLGRARPEAIFHLAGKTRGDNLGELLAANVETTSVLLELAAELNCAVLVPGSAAEYGFPRELPVRETHPVQPVTAYGMAKTRQTALALDYARRGLRVFVPRPFNLLGPGLPESFAPARLARQVAALGDGDELVVENPDTRRDFVDVRDVASAYWEILTRGRSGEVYNLCTGVGVSLEEVARGLLEASGRRARLRRGPQTDPPAAATIVGSCDKLRAELDWTPRIPLADSLRAMSLSLR